MPRATQATSDGRPATSDWRIARKSWGTTRRRALPDNKAVDCSSSRSSHPSRPSPSSHLISHIFISSISFSGAEHISICVFPSGRLQFPPAFASLPLLFCSCKRCSMRRNLWQPPKPGSISHQVSLAADPRINKELGLQLRNRLSDRDLEILAHGRVAERPGTRPNNGSDGR
jgi:hypothetical protein